MVQAIRRYARDGSLHLVSWTLATDPRSGMLSARVEQLDEPREEIAKSVRTPRRLAKGTEFQVFDKFSATEENGAMVDRLMEIRSDEFRAMAARVLEVTALTSRLNALPFEDEAGRAELLEQILGRPLPERLTVYPPFYTDHGLNLELGERVFINQGCTFLDYAGITIGSRTMIAPKVTFITSGHPVDPEERKHYLTGEPIVVEENVWIGAGATILPGVTIGHDAVIAAGAVVANDVPAQSLVAGPKATVRRTW